MNRPQKTIKLKSEWALKGKGRKRLGGETSYDEAQLTTELLNRFKGQFTKPGGRFHKKVFTKPLSVLLVHALYAMENQCSVRFSRSTSHKAGEPNPKIIIELIDFLAAERFIRQYIALPHENNTDQSCFWTTDLFAEFVKVNNKEINSVYDGDCVIVRDKERNNIPLSKKAKQIGTKVQGINKLLSQTQVTLEGKTLFVALRRVFNNSSIYLGGRYYSHGFISHQNIKKEERPSLHINGQPTVEWDFEAMHIYILYAWAGTPCRQKPYKVGELERELVKALFLRLINSNSLSAFKATVTRSGDPKVKKAIETGLHNYPKEFVDSFIKGVPDYLKGEEAYQQILTAHPQLEIFFGEENVGLKLQYEDSKIMEHILLDLCEQKIPALPLHDSVIVSKPDSKAAEDAMTKACKKVLNGFIIPIILSGT
jgi:hypothetical protein